MGKNFFKRILGVFVVAIMIYSFVFFGISAGNYIKTADAAETLSFGDGSFKYAAQMDGVNLYGGCKLTVISSDEADAKGVPSGYTAGGIVLKMENDSSPITMDMAVDFSALNLKRKAITSLSIRYYIVPNSAENNKYPDFRIPSLSAPGKYWIVGGRNVKSATGDWVTLTLTNAQIDELCEINGRLGSFAICLRSAAASVMYIDSIKLEAVEMDNTPPVINLTRGVFNVSEGSYPIEITATDDSGNCDFTYVWSDGALDERGRLKAGMHTCVVTASDASDNETNVTVTYNVTREAPSEIYKITFRAEGFDDVIIEYLGDTSEYVEAPPAPQKQYYESEWEDFLVEKSDNQIVNCVFTPKEYVVKFVADGKDVATRIYTVENMTVTPPDVPEKAGYTGEWEIYELDFSDITVNAVYTENKPDESASDETSSSEETLTGSSSSKGCKSIIGVDTLGFSLFLSLGACFVVIRKKKTNAR